MHAPSLYISQIEPKSKKSGGGFIWSRYSFISTIGSLSNISITGVKALYLAADWGRTESVRLLLQDPKLDLSLFDTSNLGKYLLATITTFRGLISCTNRSKGPRYEMPSQPGRRKNIIYWQSLFLVMIAHYFYFSVNS